MLKKVEVNVLSYSSIVPNPLKEILLYLAVCLLFVLDKKLYQESRKVLNDSKCQAP